MHVVLHYRFGDSSQVGGAKELIRGRKSGCMRGDPDRSQRALSAQLRSVQPLFGLVAYFSLANTVPKPKSTYKLM